MDDLDTELLSALRHNARISVSSLAAMTGASRATVAARIDRLVASGTIVGFTIRTGHETRSAGVRAIVMIEVLGKLADRVADQLRGLPQVRALHSTNGKWDFVAELEDRDLPSFDETLRRIRLINGINSTETNILLKTSKTGF
ncbi:DNA-binding Lrp family transcriptional regulator [Rhizobium sp. BK226]|uniref:Lrp/AsnC family transcriptional regulator n=1 Tax=Rhizobium anhuiense TaxID=1184720 RepID=A0A3S0RKA0_9HYPH|nr:AsnC family transcriptional regulator [Rhizobium anhuiense bv. trifolii]MBB3301504.1 DNA-binding Lrp family transcriptional regulator [Rhizobium sp. BK112]MBB3370626.1 DNA-binding Lrp family transcriptional regulator [Rhizobium sp. BK077]MBB3745046.1 DNA-binding Lrp family transcriptional regulator [Rhizobium sp. BK591]MBB4114899.1 DNA-binding Lrp family transcriptional regulator [Rhizobium sp. BK226]MBB4181205.1 DNA-binding Lrp family transcriptional regulator [Rhizobium sp. BK109]NKM5700